MQITNNLPTADLKEYGILTEDNTFSKRLNPKDIENFLNGHAIVADNNKDRIVFMLTENNTKLNVNIFQRDKSINDILEQSQKEIVYSQLTEDTSNPLIEKKAFVLDKNTQEITEYDLVRDIDKISQIVLEKKDIQESNKFKNELLKMKEFLQDKIDKFPEIAKDITNDMNIVSKTISTIDDATPNQKQAEKQEKSDIRLNVNDPDMYQDANREREIKAKQEQEQEQEQQQEIEVKRKTGFRR